MKRLIINILLVFLITINSIFAQKENKKIVFGMNTGITLPSSGFANKNMTYNAGFASVGANIEIDLMRYTGKYFGFCSDIGYTNIFFHKKAYKSEYERILDQFGEISVSAENYQVLHSTLGIFFKTPEFYQSEVLFLVQLGYSMSIHPEIIVNHSVWGKINSVEKDVDWQLISSFGFKINHYLSEKYGISLSYNRYATNPGFRDETSIEKIFNIPIKYQNINIGFIINL